MKLVLSLSVRECALRTERGEQTRGSVRGGRRARERLKFTGFLCASEPHLCCLCCSVVAQCAEQSRTSVLGASADRALVQQQFARGAVRAGKERGRIREQEIELGIIDELELPSEIVGSSTIAPFVLAIK